MPVKFINAPYYNLVNNTLLNPIYISKYIREFSNRYLEVVENPELLTFTLSPIVIDFIQFYNYNDIYGNPHPPKIITKQIYTYNQNRAEFYEVWKRIPEGIMLSKIGDYIQDLYEHYPNGDKIYLYSKNRIINNEEHTLLEKLIKNNTYKIKDMLIKAMCNVYFNKFIAPMVSKYLAINKIKRNAIYNTGLGLKLAVREYEKEF
jgi:hypothetical protein